MDALLNDVRFAIRSLAKSKLFTVVALGAMLFGASPVDVPIFAAVSAVLAVVALAAIWVPARRAAGVSPLEALRAE